MHQRAYSESERRTMQRGEAAPLRDGPSLAAARERWYARYVPPLAAPRHLHAVYYEIVYGCQLACRGCPIASVQPKVEKTSVDLMDRCMRNIDVDSVEQFCMYGYGEPLLHADLPALFDVLESQSFAVKRVEISTNAQHVHWDQLEEVIRTKHLTDLIVSCDGDGTPEMYEALRPPSRWERLIAFLNRARELRDRHAPHLNLTTRTIVPNWSDRDRWRDLLLPLGWKTDFRHYTYLPGAPENMTGRELHVPDGSCVFVERFNGLFINLDGTVVPCCVHPRAWVFGNLQERKFSEIYSGEARARFLHQLRHDRKSMEICGTCELDADVSNAATRILFRPEEANQMGLVPPSRLNQKRRALPITNPSSPIS